MIDSNAKQTGKRILWFVRVVLS